MTACVDINTTVQYLTPGEAFSDDCKNALTLSTIDEQYPESSWIQVYTDGSATEAVRNGGAGVFIQYPNGQQQTADIPTGKQCSNYTAEVEALTQAANFIRSSEDQRHTRCKRKIRI